MAGRQMNGWCIGVAAVCLVVAGCKKSSDSTSHGSTNETGSAPVEYLKAIDKGQKTAIQTTDSAAVNSGIQLFFMEHNRYPKSLDELVAGGYFKRLPPLPKGMHFEYDPNTGKASVVKE